jgi:uncharacterized protein YeaO (DUF488 family)
MVRERVYGDYVTVKNVHGTFVVGEYATASYSGVIDYLRLYGVPDDIIEEYYPKIKTLRHGEALKIPKHHSSPKYPTPEEVRERFIKGVTGSSLGGSVHGSRLKWVRDSAGIWWTATTDYIHSLYYDEEDKVYVWYVHSIKDFEELKREILYPPAEYEEVFEARDIEEAKKYVEEKLAGYYKPQLPAHAEKVDELVRARESGYRRLKRLARAWEKTVKSSGFKRRSVREVIENPRPDEFYVLVTRYVPIEVRVRGLKVLKEQSGVFDVWDRDLAPSPQLLSWWKAGPKTRERWEEYKRRFLSEVPEVMIRRKADIYREWAKDKTVVFVCEEEEWEYPYCHTWIILEVLEKT